MPVIKLKGLPWSCTQDEVRRFLAGVKFAAKRTFDDHDDYGNDTVTPPTAPDNDSNNSSDLGIYLTMNSEGRPSGEAFVEVLTDEDLEMARSRHQAKIGQRYIEVFKSNHEELMNQLKASMTHAHNWQDPVVRLRGLPFSCQESDVRQFFEGLNIAGSDGVLMVQDFSGRYNGEGFVRFEHIQDAHRALDKHKQKIGTRYIEVFRSTTDEMEYYWSNMKNLAENDAGGYSSSGGGGGKAMRRVNNTHYQNASNNNNASANRYNPYSRNNVNNRGGGGGHVKSPMNSYNTSNGAYYKSGYSNGDGQVASYHTSQAPSQSLQSLLNLGATSFGTGGGGYNQFDNNGDESSQSDDNEDLDEFYGGDENVVKMRGLPYNATEQDIHKFFAPLQPSRVEILYGRDRRPSGECLCYFNRPGDAEKALEYNKRYMGKRYIEIFEHHQRPHQHHSNNGYNRQVSKAPIGRSMGRAVNSQSPISQQPPQLPPPSNQFDPSAFFNQQAMAEMAKKFIESALQQAAAASQQQQPQQQQHHQSYNTHYNSSRSKRF